MVNWERHYPYREPGSRFADSGTEDDRSGGYRGHVAREQWRPWWERNPYVSGPREWIPETATEPYLGYGTMYYGRPPRSEYRTDWEPRHERSMSRERFEDEWARPEHRPLYSAYRAHGYPSEYGVMGQSRRQPLSYIGRGPKGYRPSDERIRDQVNERLTMNPDVDASEVDVRVDNGVVTLTGMVEDRHAKRLTEDIAEDVFGVDDVRNELRVRHGFFSNLMGAGETESERETAPAGERGATKTARAAR